LESSDEDIDGSFSRTDDTTEKMKVRDSNMRMCSCINEMILKVGDAVKKDVHFTEISGVHDNFRKLVDFLVEDE
ncbi:Hypothetical predicted protein, partial [Mytilus galloprovincialis]